MREIRKFCSEMPGVNRRARDFSTTRVVITRVDIKIFGVSILHMRENELPVRIIIKQHLSQSSD